jgi:hypothetical protein
VTLLATPNNPSATLVPVAELEALADKLDAGIDIAKELAQDHAEIDGFAAINRAVDRARLVGAPKVITTTVDDFTDVAKIKDQPWAGTTLRRQYNGRWYDVQAGEYVSSLARRKTNLEALAACVKGSA